MEKKFEPTPEMKAKLEELKANTKTHEVQELSVADLENVSGGSGAAYVDGVAYVCVDDPDWGTLTVDDYYDLVKWTYDNFGLDVAVGMALDIDSSVFIEQALRIDGPEYMRDTLRSRIYHYYNRDDGSWNPYSIWGTWG